MTNQNGRHNCWRETCTRPTDATRSCADRHAGPDRRVAMHHRDLRGVESRRSCAACKPPGEDRLRVGCRWTVNLIGYHQRGGKLYEMRDDVVFVAGQHLVRCSSVSACSRTPPRRTMATGGGSRRQQKARERISSRPAVGLGDRGDSRCSSGGQRRRVAIAGAGHGLNLMLFDDRPHDRELVGEVLDVVCKMNELRLLVVVLEIGF